MSIDDIVEHNDILSTPLKNGGKSPSLRSPTRGTTPSSSKSRSPTKSLIEYIQLVAKQDQENKLNEEKKEVTIVPNGKRKRGRPRKEKGATHQSTFGDHGTSSTSGSSNNKQVQANAPRKRGRPPKRPRTDGSLSAIIKKEPGGPELGDSSLHRNEIKRKQEQLDNDDSSEPVVIKRKRGRPPKSASTRRGRPPKKVKIEPAACQDAGLQLKPVTKARRGRPPKNKSAVLPIGEDSTPKRSSPERKRQVVKYTSDNVQEASEIGVPNSISCDIMGNEHDISAGLPKAEASEDLNTDLEVKLMDEPYTPLKGTPHKSISTEHDFTSPLKKVIINNLNEYKDTMSTTSIKLGRDFVPTPLPTDLSNFKSNSERPVSAFFDTFEGYFDQKKFLKSSQKSKNTMGMALDVTREEFALISNLFHENLHKSARKRLREIQERMFPQYWFEISQGFSLLFYGIGSKREFLERYAFEYLVPNIVSSSLEAQGIDIEESTTMDDYSIPCVVVNGYNPTCNYRDVFKDISQALLPEELSRNETKYWGNHVLLHIQKMIDIYKNEPPDIKLIIIVHNLDGPSLRKEVFQTMLSYLALIRQVAVIASVDHIYAPLLWDNFKAQNFNFIFHDVTNYEPLAVESSFKDVLKMSKNDLASGAEGARFVLQSLTINSKRMYKLLIETQLSNMESSSDSAKVTGKKRGLPGLGIEFKHFLHLCAAEFIVSNELSLRSMLTEFIEHKMAVLSKNPGGTEHVWVPYNYAEMKKLSETFLKSV